MAALSGIAPLTQSEVDIIAGASAPPGFVLYGEACRGGYVYRVFINSDPNAPLSERWYREVDGPCNRHR